MAYRPVKELPNECCHDLIGITANPAPAWYLVFLSMFQSYKTTFEKRNPGYKIDLYVVGVNDVGVTTISLIGNSVGNRTSQELKDWKEIHLRLMGAFDAFETLRFHSHPEQLEITLAKINRFRQEFKKHNSDLDKLTKTMVN